MAEVSQRVRLLLPEYGRNVQKMVQWLFTIEDRDLRSRQAAAVVNTMANVYPHKRDTTEFRNMLWDHLFMIAGDGLDIDTPFERPAPDQFAPTPQRVPYEQSYVIQKQYGLLVRRMAAELSKIEDLEARERAAGLLVRYMRQKSYDYNNEYPSNDVVVADLFDMTSGAVKLDGATVFNGSQIEMRVSNNKKNQPNQKPNQKQQNRNKNRSAVNNNPRGK